MYCNTNTATGYERLSLLRSGLISAARARGLNGRPFMEGTAPLGTYGEEIAVVNLVLDCQPRPRTDREKKILDRWSRNIVASSTRETVATNQPEVAGAKKWM